MLERQLAQAEASRQAREQEIPSYTDEKWLWQKWLWHRREVAMAMAAGAEGADEGTEGATSEDDAVEASDEVCCLSPCFPSVN